jgi:hydroxymethylbilane synthase
MKRNLQNNTIYIGTRSSPLALWQAGWVKTLIENRYPDISVELVPIKTRGDIFLDTPLSKVGGKGLFVKEIEHSLIEGKIDLAVHSMKDLPVYISEGLEIAAITKREDPRDALISIDGHTLKDLPKGARIGTSSLRRRAQLLHIRADLQLYDLRGNIDTRIRKLKKEGLDAICVAMAGLKRLGLDIHVTEIFPTEVIIPAVGQGSLAIEARKDSREKDIASFLNDPESAIAINAERAFLRTLMGGCYVPVAAFGKVEGKEISIRGTVSDPDGKIAFIEEIKGPSSMAESLGIELAKRILERGGKEVLQEIYNLYPSHKT